MGLLANCSRRRRMRGFSILLCIVPCGGHGAERGAACELRYASGLFNLMRNLGGAIGIAVVTTWLQDFGRLHAARFGEAMTQSGTAALGEAAQRLSHVTADASHARAMLEGVTARIVGQQALTLAFADVYMLMAIMFVAALILVPFCKTAILADGAPEGIKVRTGRLWRPDRAA